MKIFSNLKEIKKPSSQFLRVWAKNQWRLKFSEKIFKIKYENLNEKLTYYLFSIPSFRTFVILYTSGKLQHFSTTIFSGSGRGKSPPVFYLEYELLNKYLLSLDWMGLPMVRVTKDLLTAQNSASKRRKMT